MVNLVAVVIWIYVGRVIDFMFCIPFECSLFIWEIKLLHWWLLCLDDIYNYINKYYIDLY